MYTVIRRVFENAWDNRELSKEEKTRSTINKVLELLDKGQLRTAEPTTTGWQVNEWVERLLFFIFRLIKWEPSPRVLSNITIKSY